MPQTTSSAKQRKTIAAPADLRSDITPSWSLQAWSSAATSTIKSYNAVREQKIDHLAARQQVAQAMAQRYDQQGRDTQRRDRQLSQSLSR